MSTTHYFRFTAHGADGRQRCGLLERLLARADGSTEVTDWRADAFHLIAPPMMAMPGVAAAALYAERGPAQAASAQAASVFLAAPVRYEAEISNVRLPADGILSLHPSEAEALAVDFNRVWHDAGIHLLAGRRGDLFCLFDQPTVAITCDPEDVLERHIADHLPSGAAAPRLRQLMSEIEMWLFEHAVNRTRIAAATPAVNGLWLWGGGPALESLPAVDGWTAGDDPFFKAFGTPRGAASGVMAWAAEPGSAEWREAGAPRLERSVADLASGRIARLELSARHRCFSVGARWSWRFWRRPRPWWEYFA